MQVRGEFVDAAFRALDKFGPEVSISKFVAYLAEIISALADANARLNGIRFDAELPPHLAFSSD